MLSFLTRSERRPEDDIRQVTKERRTPQIPAVRELLKGAESGEWCYYFSYPEVTRIVFDVVEGRQNGTPDSTDLTREDQNKIESLKTFLGQADIDSTDKLELLVSVHYLLDCYRLSKTKTTDVATDVVTFLKEKKPYFSTEEVFRAIDRINAIIE